MAAAILTGALMSRADLLLLDEPTSGLDPLMEQAFRSCVQDARQRGQTVFLSSHVLSEVEVVFERVAILRAGRLVELGTLAGMRHLKALQVDADLLAPAPDLTSVAGVGVRHLLSREPSLEELFLANYGDERPDAA